MDARLIPTVLPVIKKVTQLQKCKDLLKRAEENGDNGVKIERYKKRLQENIEQLEKELGYENKN